MILNNLYQYFKIKTKNNFLKIDSISVVTTPMQIINCIEAIEHFKCTNNILVILYKPRQKNNQQLEKIAELYQWNKIIRIVLDPKKSRYLEYVKLIYTLKKYICKYLFIANITTIYMQIFIANIQKNKVFLVDDGTATINIYDNIIVQNKINQYSFKLFRFYFLGLKVKVLDEISLFTYFNLKSDHRFEIVKNNLTYFKKRLSQNMKDEESIIFLGQPLIETGYITKEEYVKCLEAIKKIYKNTIIYIPHRFEKEDDKLNNLIDNNFFIKNIDIPIELYFIENGINPKHIISFCTSAIFILDKMYEFLLSETIIIPKEKFLKNSNLFYTCYDSLKDQTKSKNITYKDLKL